MARHTALVLGLVAIFGVQVSLSDVHHVHHVHHVLQECVEENGITMADADAFMINGTASQNLKCAFKCVLEKIDVINKDGTLEVELLVALNPGDREAIVRKCSSMPPGDQCENAYLHYKCDLDEDPEYFRAGYKRLKTDV